MANDLTYTQVAPIFNEIIKQATGQEPISTINNNEFINVSQTALKIGLDPFVNAISTVLSRTIFSYRPYTSKMLGLEVSQSQWGGHVRKLAVADTEFEKVDPRFAYPVTYDSTKTPPNGDGGSVDMYTIKKPSVLQTNFYGQNVLSDHYTLAKDQLTIAFQNQYEFQQFIQMVVANFWDKLEQQRELIARSVLLNLIGSILDENQNGRVIHLLQEYNAMTGLNLTAQSVMQPSNYKSFIQWLHAKIATISGMMSERSILFQTVINNKPVMRHTPYRDLRLFMTSQFLNDIKAMAYSNTYHDDYLKLSKAESVNYWQSIEEPTSIDVKPVYVGTTGQVVEGAQVETGAVVGVLFDREAAGYAITQQWSAPTPFNVKGGYWNVWFHRTFNAYNDITEKAVVFTLD